MAAQPWRIAHDGIVLAEILEISLQRTRLTRPFAHNPPPSYGRAPLAAGSGVALAGMGADEGFWIGFQPLDEDTQSAVRVRLEAPSDIDLVSGRQWMPALTRDPRNYLVVPPERFLSAPRDAVEPAAFDGPEKYRQLLVEIVGVRRGVSPNSDATLDPSGWERIADARVRVDLLTSSEFTRATGVTPRPLAEGDRYQGRRYP